MENKRGVVLNIGNKQYRVWVSFGATRKTRNEDYGMDTVLRTHIYNITESKMELWKDIQGTYLEEKVSDYIENSFNGQESIYWNFNWEGRK
ncbi:hypothetical protein UT300003_32620 [Clostridium sardiniense]